MRIAYVTTYDSADVHAWSGLGYRMMLALESAGCEIVPIGGLRKPGFLRHAVKKVFYIARGKDYQRDRDPRLLRAYARQVEEKLAGLEVDAVFSPGTIPIAKLETELPLVFWTDSVFHGIVGYYPEFSNLCAETLRDGHTLEQEALSRCTLAIYASEWAVESAKQHYGLGPDKVKMVPFGASVTGAPGPDAIEEIVAARPLDECRLLWIGVDWERKGGVLAVKVAAELNRRGIPTRLEVVGCDPPSGLPEFVRPHGFVSKNTPEGRELCERLLRESHFLILPSVAECFGVVFAEASAYGLPSLATRTGGIPSAVRDGVNGRTFPLSCGPATYADFVQQLLSEPESYRQLARSSFREYEQRLNWETAGRQVRELIAACVERS